MKNHYAPGRPDIWLVERHLSRFNFGWIKHNAPGTGNSTQYYERDGEYLMSYIVHARSEVELLSVIKGRGSYRNLSLNEGWKKYDETGKTE